MTGVQTCALPISYKELCKFFVEVLKWENTRSALLPDLQYKKEFVIYANAKGMLIAHDVAAYFCEEHNPMYNAKRAAAEGYKLFCRPGACPFDLIKYGMLKGILPDVQFPFDNGKEILQQNWDFLDFRQLAVLRMLQGRLDEAITLLPIPFMYMRAGEILYETGQNYASAISYLQMGYNLAAQEGMAMLMLQCRIIIGNCYSNQQELENMEREYQIASRLARDLHQTEILKVINYNRASTWVALGSYKKAYDYFSKVEEPAILDLHKLAICCEAYGRKAEGIEAVKRAERMGEFGDDPDDEKQLEVEMCRLVRYRLEHENYLKEEEYEKLLFPCFEKMKARLDRKSVV